LFRRIPVEGERTPEPNPVLTVKRERGKKKKDGMGERREAG
jgi:hypothetical protein